MLTHMIVYDTATPRVTRITMPIHNPLDTSPYFVKTIDGLGPVKASIVHEGYAFEDGSGYVSSKTEIRNIGMTIGYRPRTAVGKSVQTLRRELYKIFPTNTEVIVRFLSDDFVPVQIRCWVESHDPVIFSQEPEVRVVLLGLNPWLQGDNVVSIEFDHDPSLTNSSKYMNIRNEGDVETGMLYGFFVSPSAPDIPEDTNILLDNLHPRGGRSTIVIRNSLIASIIPGGKLKAGDTIYVESKPGHRGVSFVRNGLWYNAIGAIQNPNNAVETQWSSLVPSVVGTNRINYSVTGTNAANTFAFTSVAATYTPLYEGV